MAYGNNTAMGATPMAIGNNGLVRVMNNSQIDAMNAEKEREKFGLTAMNKPAIKELASYITKCWEYAKQNKNTIETKIEKAQRQRKGEYDSSKLTEIQKHGGSTVFRGLTKIKCVAAESWINEIINTNKMFDCEPTPMPDLKPEIQKAIKDEAMKWFIQRYTETGGQVSPVEVYDFACEMRKIYDSDSQKKARFSAERMRQKIHDQFVEGGFYEALKNVVNNLTTYPSAIMKGPIFRMERTLKWVEAEGNYTPQVKIEPKMQFERVSPYDFFPSPDCTDGQDGYIIERMKLSRKDLISLKGVPGYKDDEIDNVLKTYSSGIRFNESYDTTRDALENKSIFSPDNGADPGNVFDSLEFWGSVSGRILKEWGMTKEIDDNLEYDIWAIMIGEYVIKAELNPDPLGERPYYITSYYKEPGVIWGSAIPESMEDTQDICNAVVRALVNNLALGSGPQAMVNTEALAPGEDITSMYPGKIWQYCDPDGKFGGNAIQFRDVPVNAQELLFVYEKMKMESDEQTGIPRYVYGSEQVGGGASTARGLSMLFNAANKSIKNVIANIDRDIIEPIVTYMYNWNMQNTDDPEIKGDIKVKALGTTALAIKEQLATMRQEFLNSTLNPIDSQLIPPEGRLKILREQVKDLGMPEDSIIPSELEMKQRTQAAEQVIAQQAQAENPNPDTGSQRSVPKMQSSTGLPNTPNAQGGQ
jgi:hypothetical protein